MEFVLLIYQGTTPLPGSDAWAVLPDEEQRGIYADYAAVNATAGVTPGLPLGLPENAKTVRVENGTIVVADGPYVDRDGAVAGYMILDAEDLDAALDLARRVPAARYGGAIEVRPVERYW